MRSRCELYPEPGYDGTGVGKVSIKARIIIRMVVVALAYSAIVAFFVYRVARLPFWIALLFPIFGYLCNGLLNIIGTWLERQNEKHRPQKLAEGERGATDHRWASRRCSTRRIWINSP